MPKVVGPVNQAVPLDINISGMTPHVFAYKLWWRDTANPNWTVIGQGSTGDQTPDFYQHAFAPGAQLFHWIGIAGKPNSSYDGIITIGQNGKVLMNGVVHVTGSTNAKGIDVQQDWMNFV
jgi:hypothetical protein